MKHTIYANYGTLGHEKGTAYSAYVPMSTADLSEAIVVDIPDEFRPYKAADGSITLTPPNPDNFSFTLSEILKNDVNGDPILRWPTHPRSAEIHKLTIIDKPNT